MRINEDYYIENVYTLIRVPNHNANLNEFASRYFCLQSNSTHNVYVVWKRRNRVRRIDKRSPPKLLLGHGPTIGHSDNQIGEVRPSSSQTRKRIRRRCDSSVSLTESYSESSSSEYFENKQAALETIQLPKRREVLLKLFKRLPARGLSKGLPKSLSKSLTKFGGRSHRCKYDPIQRTTKKSELLIVKNRVTCQQFGRSKSLLRTITNKLKAFGSKVEDASSDSILLHLHHSPTREVLLDHQNDSSCVNSHPLTPQLANDNRPDPLDQENQPKKLFSGWLGRLSSRTAKLVRTLKSSKDDELTRMKLAKTKVKCAMRNIRHNLINIITSKKKRD